MQKIARLVADIIEAVAAGSISTRKQFTSRVAEIRTEIDPEVAQALHQAGHYIDDADIRAQDQRYHDIQSQALRDCVRVLRAK